MATAKQKTANRAAASPAAQTSTPTNAAQLIDHLQKLGRLPAGFDGGTLLPLLAHKKEKVRKLAAANLGKLASVAHLPPLSQTARHDASTTVRREAASAIGRMRAAAAVPILIELTADPDPKIVLQALRGLLNFPKSTAGVPAAMERLKAHPNEMVRDIIRQERTYHFDAAGAKQRQIACPDYMKNVIVEGDVLRALKHAPDSAVHLTFTSPPYYNARDYSIYASYGDYLRFLQKVFKQVHRITKPGRFFILNTSPIIIPRVSRQNSSRRYPIPFDLHPLLVKMGWEFIDDIVWVKPEASVKNRNGGFYQHRKPLAYKPNACTEYLMVYRKQTDRLIDWNIRQYSDAHVERSKVKRDYETTNVWNIDPTFDKTHSAVFPVSLCNRVISYYSMKDDLIFDPFGGSGTLGGAAALSGRHFFMTELSPDYITRMKERFSKVSHHITPTPRFTDIPQFQTMKKNHERQTIAA